MTEDKLSRKGLRIWLAVSLVFAVIGAFTLFPIGNGFLNFLFIVTKIGMVSGLLRMLVQKKPDGYRVWAWFSFIAVIMTIVKWALTGHARAIFVLAILADIIMPAAARRIAKKA